jgi:glutamyl-Q tRNA(Asp) synthetase
LSPQDSPSPSYRGRFAPSPTGALHAGSLVAAVASFLDARAHGGQWHLRIDDIDPPREVAGSSAAIQTSLIRHGLLWDDALLLQSAHQQRYNEALEKLWRTGLLFRCFCTRQTLSASGSCQADCASRSEDSVAYSLRIRIPSGIRLDFEDRILGTRTGHTSTLPDNFIVQRRDGLVAYQLAAAVDDAQPLYSHVVRGADLIDSTHRQLWLQRVLELAPPEYAHVPVVRDKQGIKLSKQSGAQALDDDQAATNLRRALVHLNQPLPPKKLIVPEDILRFATDNWCMAALRA